VPAPVRHRHPGAPDVEQVQAEYETVWRTLDGRPIESLIDLPLMTDPELQAAMRLFFVLANAAFFTDFHLFCLLMCRMVNVSMQHGTSGVSANACGYLGLSSARVSPLPRGLSFAKLACDLVEKNSSSQVGRKFTPRWDSLPSGRSRSRARSSSFGQPFALRSKRGI